MTTDLITESTTKFAKVSSRAFKIFGDDLACMFRASMSADQQDACIETLEDLQKRFKKLAMGTTAETKGELNGTFAIIFDQEAMFTIAGTIVMQPKPRILENRNMGTKQDALDLQDVIREAGNLFFGSWNRAFESEWEGPVHCLQTETFIGDPWSDLCKTLGISETDEFMLLIHDVTLNDFEPFQCGVIFPSSVINDAG